MKTLFRSLSGMFATAITLASAFLFVRGVSFAQEEFVPNRVIVKFNESGALSATNKFSLFASRTFGATPAKFPAIILMTTTTAMWTMFTATTL